MRSVFKRWFLRTDTEVGDVVQCIFYFKGENTRYDSHTHVDTQWWAERDHQHLVFLLMLKICYTKKEGWLNIYRENFPLHQRAGFGQQRLGSISQHLDSYRSPQPTSAAWTHHAPQEPASPYLPVTQSSASISLHALSPCLFSHIVTKGRGRREQYLFTTWWHHL